MRVIAALVMMSAVLSAQGVPVVLRELPQQQRQGVFQTPSWDVPADAAGTLQITAQINTADYDDPLNSLRMTIYRLDASQGVWRLVVGGTWVGGHVEDPELGTNPQPSIGTNLEHLRGQTIRGEADIPLRMRIGFRVESVAYTN